MGVFAKEKISLGTFLISERPMIWQKMSAKGRLSESSGSIIMPQMHMQFETKMLKLSKNSPQFNRKIKRLYREGLAEVSLAERSDGRDLSVKDIIEAKDMNAFYTERLPLLGEESADQFRLDSAILLYDICSMLNHSCQANCKYFHVGPTMVVFAFQNILPGQELLIQYTEKSNILQSKWGINCCCAFCKNSVNSKKRRAKVLSDKIKNGGSVSPQQFAQVERINSFEVGLQSLYQGRSETCALFLLRTFGLNRKQAEEVMEKLEIKSK